MNLDLLTIRLRKLAAIAVRWSYRGAFVRHGVAPAIEHEAVLGGLDFDFVADVGANRGQFSLVCRRVRPKARIVAFEPLAGARCADLSALCLPAITWRGFTNVPWRRRGEKW